MDDPTDPPAEVLSGGVANAGAVVRVGDHVLRPSSASTASVHAYLRALAAAGFTGASVPVGVDDDGRERLVFVEGDVAVPPYPGWVQADEALASIAELLAGMHRTAHTFDPTGLTWSDELADPAGGDVVCHNDVCLENVVFRDGVAVALLDFDWAAPGRPVWDVAQMARMCVPVDDPVNAARLGWEPADLPGRLAMVAEVCALDADERAQLVGAIDGTIAAGGAFVARHVEAGHPGFVAMWEAMGGMRRFDRRRAWWDDARPAFVARLG